MDIIDQHQMDNVDYERLLQGVKEIEKVKKNNENALLLEEINWILKGRKVSIVLK